MPVVLRGPELPTPHTDLAHCRQTLSGGSRSFWVASQLLPTRLRNDACALYAFCRDADDLIDEGGNPDAGLELLSRRLDGIYSGNPLDYTVDRALSRTVLQHALPRELLDALLEGFAWDAAGRRYHTLSELIDYAARVAGGVGVMMSVLMGVRDPNALARAADLGVAMQLTNIARDVGEDARNGRLYLPITMLAEAGIDAEQFLANPVFNDALHGVVESLLATADTLYHRSESGIPALPRVARPGIFAARLLYAEIGHELRRLGGDSVSRRTVVSGRDKVRVILRSFGWLQLGTTALHHAVLPECQFLVHAVRPAPITAAFSATDGNPIKVFYRRLIWMLDLFAVLEGAGVSDSSLGSPGHSKRQ